MYEDVGLHVASQTECVKASDYPADAEEDEGDSATPSQPYLRPVAFQVAIRIACVFLCEARSGIRQRRAQARPTKRPL